MTNLAPSPEDIRQAQQQLLATIASEQAAGIPSFDRTDAVTDVTRTPFLMAMKTNGYKVRMNPAGCQVLETCPYCRGSNRHTFTKADQEVKLCSDCKK